MCRDALQMEGGVFFFKELRMEGVRGLGLQPHTIGPSAPHPPWRSNSWYIGYAHSYFLFGMFDDIHHNKTIQLLFCSIGKTQPNTF